MMTCRHLEGLEMNLRYLMRRMIKLKNINEVARLIKEMEPDLTLTQGFIKIYNTAKAYDNMNRQLFETCSKYGDCLREKEELDKKYCNALIYIRLLEDKLKYMETEREPYKFVDYKNTIDKLMDNRAKAQNIINLRKELKEELK